MYCFPLCVFYTHTHTHAVLIPQIHMWCTYIIQVSVLWYKYIHICCAYTAYTYMCIMPISCTYMQTHYTYSYKYHILYTYQSLHTCTHCVPVSAQTNVEDTHFHAYTYNYITSMYLPHLHWRYTHTWVPIWACILENILHTRQIGYKHMSWRSCSLMIFPPPFSCYCILTPALSAMFISWVA